MNRSCVETQRPRERGAKTSALRTVKARRRLVCVDQPISLSLASVTGAGNLWRHVLCGHRVWTETNQAAPHPAPVARERPTWFATEPSVDYVVAAVDVKRLAGDQLRWIHGEERHGDTNVLNRHQATRGSFRLRLLQ